MSLIYGSGEGRLATSVGAHPCGCREMSVHGKTKAAGRHGGLPLPVGHWI